MTWLEANAEQDSLSELSLVCIPSHTRHFPSSANLYFSPALTTSTSGGWTHLKKHGVRVYICGGTAEGMEDEILALAKGMKADGLDVMLHMVSLRAESWARLMANTEQIDGMGHSDFVNFDRDDRPMMGWTWPIVRKDFLLFWSAWTNGTPFPAC